jgi:tetratricopeptide (TPR) repeat protein
MKIPAIYLRKMRVFARIQKTYRCAFNRFVPFLLFNSSAAMQIPKKNFRCAYDVNTFLLPNARSFIIFNNMKFFAAFALALFLALPLAHAQENPDDQYVVIYTLIQQGDAYLDSGQPQRALEDYVEAQGELQKFQQVYSDWNPNIVSFRMNYLAQKIAALTPQGPATNTPPSTVNTPPPDLQSQVSSLSAQIRQLQSDNDTLQSKLKEALSAQPATVSADAFAQVQQQVRELAKQNDLLKTALAQATNAPTQANPQLQQALAQQTARANQLVQQNQSLQARVQVLTTEASAAEALQEENALLKKQMSMMAAASTNGSPAPAINGNSDLATALQQIAQLKAEATENWLERKALENRVQEMQVASVNAAVAQAPSADTADLQSQVRELTRERDNLLAQLGEAGKKSGGKNQPTAAQMDALAQQVETLRARVSVDEAQAVPYTSQELALFQPGSITANKQANDLPGGSAVLVAEAQNYFTNREYDKAAADYQEILKEDKNNPVILANLASIEVEQNKITDADKHVQAALAANPNDAFALTIQGRVKFAQGNYDASLDILGRAEKLDPQNPQIENFLGVALAEKGLRTQAETAFRKAIQIDPDYADAHKNLTIFYLTANPPMVELARWHYEKALAAGLAPSPDLEKMLDQDSPHSAQ